MRIDLEQSLRDFGEGLIEVVENTTESAQQFVSKSTTVPKTFRISPRTAYILMHAGATHRVDGKKISQGRIIELAIEDYLRSTGLDIEAILPPDLKTVSFD